MGSFSPKTVTYLQAVMMLYLITPIYFITQGKLAPCLAAQWTVGIQLKAQTFVYHKQTDTGLINGT